MSYRKFSADNIFTGNEMLGNNHVLITDEKGTIETIVEAVEAGDGVQHFDGILSPGFINCHCHLELSHLKGLIPQGTGLIDFVRAVLRQRHCPKEEILTAIEKAESEMLQNGIVAAGDICNTPYTIHQKTKNNLRYYNFIEASGFIPQFAEKRFQEAKHIYEKFVNGPWVMGNDQNIHYPPFHTGSSLVPHAAYSVSKELFHKINEFSREQISSIHNQETKEENEFFITGKSDFERLYRELNIDISFYQPSGKSSLQTYLPLIKDTSQLLLVHNTFANEEDIAFACIQSAACDQKLYWCLCPNANLYIENSLPPIDLLRKYSSMIVLGTDSLASNAALNIVGEMKTIIRNYPFIAKKEILQWATFNGAKALQMDNLFGSFEKGKQPGIICLQENFETVQRLL